MLLEVIYKVDIKGKVRTYQIEIDGSKYRMITGLEDGKKTASKWTIAKAKNIGRSNATTPDTQAKAEAKARYDKKLQEHYHLTKELAIATPEKFFKPMLAIELAKIKGFKEELYVYDPKLDGMRLETGKTFFHSRTGKPVPTAFHIYSALKEFFRKFPNVVLDGEIYNHAYKDDFNALMSLARKTKPTRSELSAAEDVLQYHVYDMYDSENPNMDTIERKAWLRDNLLQNIDASLCFRFVDFVRISDTLSLDQIKQNNLEDGFEGTMARLITGTYKNTRTKELIKIKDFITEEFMIVDIIEGRGNRSGIAGAVAVQVGDIVVPCGVRGTHEYAGRLLANRLDYIGTEATVRHFGFTPDKSLRFPVCIDVDRTILE